MIGGALLLAVVLWMISLGPSPAPFAFLHGGHQRYVSVHRSVFTASYHVARSQEAVIELAAPELAGWTRGPTDTVLDSVVFARGGETVTIVGWNFGTAEQPLTHVMYERPAEASDFPRAWMSTLRSWLP